MPLAMGQIGDARVTHSFQAFSHALWPAKLENIPTRKPLVALHGVSGDSLGKVLGVR